MQKTILITGATDGIGLATAKELAAKGHNLIIHGRNSDKLSSVKKILSELTNAKEIHSYVADFTSLSDVFDLADKVAKYHTVDVLINNAGVFKTPMQKTTDGLDVRFAVNTIAPYLLTKKLISSLSSLNRVINLSSAAQAPVNFEALLGNEDTSSEMEAYAQSKLAITMWSYSLAAQLGDEGPTIIAVNPGSMLGSKMVTEGFGVQGGDITIGSKILSRLALDDEFDSKSGKYFDNDSKCFALPHADAINIKKCEDVIEAIESVIENM